MHESAARRGWRHLAHAQAAIERAAAASAMFLQVHLVLLSTPGAVVPHNHTLHNPVFPTRMLPSRACHSRQ